MRLIAVLLLAVVPPKNPLPLIEEFNETVQQRIENPLPNTLGMSRVMIRPSLGTHFRPLVSDMRDYAPETDKERDLLASLERQDLQVGLYVFGAAILNHTAEEMDFRSLKGPGAITKDTPRPRWCPAALVFGEQQDNGDALPDWRAMYPLAQRAMKNFADGGHGFETQLDTWNVVARPAIAREGRCVACHNSSRGDNQREFAVGDALGGVLYAYRMSP
jgi:hypothetical protein